jgi:pimeloyl-ACP methyl ester carboxylesterase
MSFSYDTRDIDSLLVRTTWRIFSEVDTPYTSLPDSHWDVIVVKQNQELCLLLSGTTTKVRQIVFRAGVEYVGINFKPSVYIPQAPLITLLNTTRPLVRATGQTFWLHDTPLESPDFETADIFIEKLELVTKLVKRGYRVVSFDNRDVGLSTHMTEAGPPDEAVIGKSLEADEPAPIPYTLQDMTRDAVGLLDALEIQQAHSVGISMGGAVPQLVAIDFPERVLSLTSLMVDSGNPNLPVIADSEAFAGLPPPPPAEDKAAFTNYQVQTLQILAGSEYPADEATLRAWVTRSVERSYDREALTRQQTVSFVGHLESASYRLSNLQNITAPTIVLHGTDDPLVPVASAEDIAARIPDAELRLVPGLGHDIPLALVPEFVDAIISAAERAVPN